MGKAISYHSKLQNYRVTKVQSCKGFLYFYIENSYTMNIQIRPYYIADTQSILDIINYNIEGNLKSSVLIMARSKWACNESEAPEK